MQFNNLNEFSKQGSSGTTKKNDTVNSVAVDTVKKSKLDLSYSHKTTFNAGVLVPIYQQEVLPGDIVDIDVKTLIRMSLPSAPVMDAPRYDINFFFVPYKQVWNKFPYLIGTSYDGGAPVVVSHVPLINFDTNFSYNNDDFSTHMEIPSNVNMSKIGFGISSLPFRSYVKVWNEWYRDENLMSSADFSNINKPDDDSNVSEFDLSDVYQSAQIGKGFLPVCRLRDYFASSLPFIQKGEAPLISTIDTSDIQKMFNETNFNLAVGNDSKMPIVDGNQFNPWVYYSQSLNPGESANNVASGSVYGPLNYSSANVGILNPITPSLVFSDGGSLMMNLKAYNSHKGNSFVSYTGNGIGQFNITDLRTALVQQHQKELDARAGTRYYEKLLSYWGIELNPLEIGRTELIGGFNGLININNVVQSAPATSVTSSSPIGSLYGLSITTDEYKNGLKYSVSQYGLILGFITVRSNITYSQGLSRLFTNISNWDFYNPTFEGISEQPIYKRELFLSENSDNNSAVFGYNQPFAFLKYRYNVASGLLGANADLSYYQLYTYQNKINSSPTLSNEWITYPSSAIQNTLLLQDSHREFINDFLADFYFDVSCYREIPVYSIPGVNKV